MKCYQSGYHRPQFVRAPGSWENLDGKWDFAFDDKNEGQDKMWPRNFSTDKKITVPFTYEYSASGIGDETRHDVVWYRRAVTINKNALRGKRIFIHFEGSDFLTKVWINGVFAGEHSGAYARFSFDITCLVKNGENIIAVRVEDSFDMSQPRGKQRWKGENFGCWYVQQTGIWKSVWLEYVPESHIERVKMTPRFFERTLEVEAEFCLPPARGEEFGFTAEISFGGKFVSRVTVPVNKKRVSVSLDVNSPDLYERGIYSWSPETPDLYDIKFTVAHNGKICDEVLSYFGMRDISIKDSSVLLNGVPLYQRLILDQGYWKDTGLTPPDEQALIDDIDKVMAAGYNGVRKHQKIEDERFLYWADVKGLLVWSEAAAAYEFNDDAVTNFTREWMEIIKQNHNHPSIITWTPFNESWGVPHIRLNTAQQQFTEAVYYLTKSYDPYRPVICNDGWEHTISDIITLHDYEERGEDFLERYGDFLDEILDNDVSHNKHHFAFAEAYEYRGQPVILSEFGGIAFSNLGKGWGYGNKVDSEEEYIKRFDAITTAIKRVEAICGFCYTQVTDVQQEVNGIMDMERNFKVKPEILKEINTRKAGNRYR